MNETAVAHIALKNGDVYAFSRTVIVVHPLGAIRLHVQALQKYQDAVCKTMRLSPDGITIVVMIKTSSATCFEFFDSSDWRSKGILE